MVELFTSETRLYELTWRDGDFDLPVEAWWGREALSGGFEFQIDLLAADAFIELKRMMAKTVTLYSTTADGGRVGRTGVVRAAAKLGADGGFARYRLTVVPWTWLMGRTRNNRVFQNKTVIEILDRVFGAYQEHAAWHWADDIAPFLADARPHSYCVQYRESDYAFMSRLLAEEGLGWCIEEDASAPAGHRLRLFADSRDLPEDALSQHANGGQGIRYHRADSQEEQDAVVAFGAHRRFGPAVVSALSYDYKAKRAVAVSVPTHLSFGGAHAPALERYDDAGLYAWADSREAERYQRLAMEAFEARYKTFFGRGTVRSFRPGTGFDLVGTPFDATGDTERRFSLLAVDHVGINNLSGEAIAAVARRLAEPGLFDDAGLTTGDASVPVAAPAVPAAELLALAQARGYGNAFEAQSGQLPWRPVLADGTGQRHPKPTVAGPMTAIVVGPNGETRPNGADELHTDRYGRVKVRFHWQQGEADDDRSSCWIRVGQRQAGAGMGWQWLPRIGQEVLVTFLGNDIDRPVILGSLYNGRGEAGITPTPGGAETAPADLSVFNAAADHAPAAQGNLTGGQSPAWHGAAANSHGHAAALTGFKSKEFGGAGHSQLVLDDSDGQQRVQLKTSQHASELNLGHLIHQADNHRGSFRGTGAELRTDAWGALRAGYGIVMTTWPGTAAQPAGDLAPGIALLKQATTLAEGLSQAAASHQTVQLAAAVGSLGPKQSVLDDKAAPIRALATMASGMVDARDPDQAAQDAQAKHTTVAKDKLPHLTDAAIVQAAKGGLGIVAGQAIQYTGGETVSFLSGGDSNLAVAGKARIQAGQAIGLLAGAVRPGDSNTGIHLVAARDDVTFQAQSDVMKFQARNDVKLVSVAADIDFAAAKKITFAVEGGASITIDGGITVKAPGTITVHASSKSFNGPASMGYALPQMAGSHICIECLLKALKSGSAVAST